MTNWRSILSWRNTEELEIGDMVMFLDDYAYEIDMELVPDELCEVTGESESYYIIQEPHGGDWDVPSDRWERYVRKVRKIGTTSAGG